MPAGREVELFLVTREHAATFRAAPGRAVAAPGAADLACPAWCSRARGRDTGWPATLESAVLSGHAAARGRFARSS